MRNQIAFALSIASMSFVVDITGNDLDRCDMQGEKASETCQKHPPSGSLHMAGIVARGLGCYSENEKSEGVNVSRNSSLQCIFDKLFPLDTGFESDDATDNADEELGMEGTYGEITPNGLQTIVENLGIKFGGSVGSEDVFLDAGSGVGKLPIQIFLTTSAMQAIGVELHPRRCAHALAAAESLHRTLGPRATWTKDDKSKSAVLEVGGRQLRLLCGDLRTLTLPGSALDLRQVSIFFMNSLCFPTELMLWMQRALANTLSPGALVFSSRDLVGCHRGLAKLRVLSLVGTDSVPPVLSCYVVVPPFGASSEAFRSLDVVKVQYFAQKERWTMMRRIDSSRLLAGFRQRLPRHLSAQSVSIQSEKFVAHRRQGEDKFHVCLLRDLINELLVRGDWALTTSDWHELTSVNQSDADNVIVVDDLGNTLYHYAVELRSSKLLRALHHVSAPPGINVANSAGEVPCETETTEVGDKLLGTGLSSLASELEGDSAPRPPGSLLPLLRELGAACSSR